jgi:hypothetical protein
MHSNVCPQEASKANLPLLSIEDARPKVWTPQRIGFTNFGSCMYKNMIAMASCSTPLSLS